MYGVFIPPLFSYLPLLNPFSSSYGVTLSAVGSPHMSLILLKVSSELLSTFLRRSYLYQTLNEAELKWTLKFLCFLP